MRFDLRNVGVKTKNDQKRCGRSEKKNRTAPHGGVIVALKMVKNTGIYLQCFVTKVGFYFRTKNRVHLQRLSYAVINHWHLQTLVAGFNFSCEACKELQTIST